MNTLFGIMLAPLFAALAQVESNNGITSDNVYQIRAMYVEDVNRIAGTTYTTEDLNDKTKSEEMMLAYWTYYGNRYRRITGLQPTAEVLARIHNGGPNGWRMHATEKYWDKVRSKMEDMR